MPWCPSCRIEYREGFSQCQDCQVELVDELTDESVAEPAAEPPCVPQPKEEFKVYWRDPEGAPRPGDAYKGFWEAPDLSVRDGMIIAAAFMLAYHFVCQILSRVVMEPFHHFFSWDFFYYAVKLMYIYLLPVLYNLIFFTGAFVIVNKQKIRDYFTNRNVLFNVLITLGGAVVMRAYILCVFHIIPIEYLYWVHLPVMSASGVLVLALIYRHTIMRLPLRKILLSRMAICVYVISILLIAAQIVYNQYFYTRSFPRGVGDYTQGIYMLYLLWLGILVSNKSKAKENGTAE